MKLVVFCSGSGSNLKAIYKAIENKILIASLECVVLNTQEKSLDFCKEHNINYVYQPFNRVSETRKDYDSRLLELVCNYQCDLVVLAGWMHIVSEDFIKTFPNIINLHPALPGTFVGTNCIRKAYDEYHLGNIEYTGAMVHRVIKEVDRGAVIEHIKVPIKYGDSYEDLEERVKLYEKGVLISAIQKFIAENNNKQIKNTEIYTGKVRDVENIGYNLLLMKASNRISAFDKHLTNIDNKGVILNRISEYWFKNTGHIIDNHYLHSSGQYMVVKKCRPIKLEIVVRGYMTGSSNTSIWTHYKNGKRDIYGLTFRDGYKKNEKLDSIIITPTTKGIVDEPITKKQICEKYLTDKECDFIYEKSIELFRYGQESVAKKGLILVDTKYEFGYYDNKIILMDELHTCDSSRYWLKKSYEERLENGEEPDKLDKDVIRDWVKINCDPYVDTIPSIPKDMVDKVSHVYETYYSLLTGEYLNQGNMFTVNKKQYINYYLDNINKDLVIILAGSVKDKFHIEKLKQFMYINNIYCVIFYCSAHKEIGRLLDILNDYENSGKNIVYITCAGRSNALSGVVACNTKYPVIACPVFSDKTDMAININSTLQCPSKVPVMVILEPENVALSVKRIWKRYN